jgi:hypothetical protein
MSWRPTRQIFDFLVTTAIKGGGAFKKERDVISLRIHLTVHFVGARTKQEVRFAGGQERASVYVSKKRL